MEKTILFYLKTIFSVQYKKAVNVKAVLNKCKDQFLDVKCLNL